MQNQFANPITFLKQAISIIERPCYQPEIIEEKSLKRAVIHFKKSM